MAAANDRDTRQFLGISPQFLVDDVAATVEYYRDTLGFRIDFLWGDPPNFGGVYRDHVMIFFNRSDPPGRRNSVNSMGAGNGSDAHISVAAVDALYAEIRDRKARIIREPQTDPHGMREFVVEDCNGYVLCFGQAVGD